MKKSSKILATKLDPLRPIVKKNATLHSPMKKIFSSCLRASFVKSFEFVDLATKQKHDNAFFLTPTLRGITEDIIYFHFLSKIPNEIREQVIKNLQFYEICKCLKDQNSFFKTFRPFQPTITSLSINKKEISNKLRLFWQQNGWPNLKKTTPPVREIAEKSYPGVLEVVYDFIYRLTSMMVHFNPQILLRSGWGPSNLKHVTFNFQNMNCYYLSINQIYGSYLFCLHFELFKKFFKLNKEEKVAVKKLREYILFQYSRWPEMITYEEMNIPVPKPPEMPNMLYRAIYAILSEEGFLSGAEKILDKNNPTNSNRVKSPTPKKSKSVSK